VVGLVSTLDARGLIGMSMRVLRTHPARVIVPAGVVFGVSAIADTFVVAASEHEQTVGLRVFILLLTVASTLGFTFYAGLLDRLVGSVERGDPAESVPRVLITLPYGPLVLADLVLWFLAVVAVATLLLPGLILFTLFCIVGPVINMEGLGVLGGLRRSWQLIRPHFWLAFLFVTTPLLIEHALIDAVEVAVPHENLWLVFTSHAMVGIVVGSAVGLLEVSLAEQLVQESRLRASSKAEIPDGAAGA
jgi:hypothetical protein